MRGFSCNHRLTDIVAELIAEAARDGDVRADIDAVELARYSLSALAAAAGVESGAAVGRLAMVTLSGLMSSGWPRGGGAAELTR